jgi:hypothetical protein
MASLGLLQACESPSQLVAVLGRAVAQTAAELPRLAAAPTAASLVLAVEPRLQAASFRRARLLRPAAAATLLAVGGWAFLSDDAYPLVARALDLEPISSIATERPEVALVIRSPASSVPALVGVLRRAEAQARSPSRSHPTRERFAH